MEMQELFNYAVAIIAFFIVFGINAIKQSIRDLIATDKHLTDEVAKVKILVAGEYVQRDELTGVTNALFVKLDRIEDKLDKKADKP